MFMCTLLLVILPLFHASKRETFNLSDTINTDENYVRNKDQRNFLQNNEKKDNYSRDAENVNILERQVILDGRKTEVAHMQRQKRSWGAIFAGVSAGFNVVGLALSIAQALTKGCFYYPSICINKRIIETLEKDLKKMRAEYKTLYRRNRKEFLNLMTANSNNAYIFYYTNDTIQNINTLKDLESILSAKLEEKFPQVYAKYTDAQNVTSKEYLDNILGLLEYRISDINKMIKDQQKAMVKQIIIQVMVGAATKVISFGMKKYNKKVAMNKQIFELMKSHGVSISNTKYKTLGKNNYRMSEAQSKAIMKDIVVGRKLDKKPIKQSKRPKLKNIVLGGLGFLADIAGQVYSVLQWKKTSEKVKKARVEYEKHFAKFFKELENIRNETVELYKRWSDVIFTFNRTTLVFKTLMKGANNYTQFNADVGTSQLPMNTSNPIFDIDYQTLNRNNIQSAQERVLVFLKDIDNDVMKLVDKMYARTFLYEKVLNMTDSKKTIDNIFDSVTGILGYRQSKTQKKFGASLSKKDITCVISLLRCDLQEYDSFPLVFLRPKCNASINEYKNNEQIATKRRCEISMNDVIVKALNTNKSSPDLGDLLESIRNAIFAIDNPEMSRYGGSLTEKDVLCSIANQFPSKQEYDFLSLIPFRSDCGAVDEKTFKEMKAEAETVKHISLQINSVLITCETFQFCPCPLMISNMFGITTEKVIDLIRLQWGSRMKKYCGTKGCSCVELN